MKNEKIKGWFPYFVNNRQKSNENDFRNKSIYFFEKLVHYMLWSLGLVYSYQFLFWLINIFYFFIFWLINIFVYLSF